MGLVDRADAASLFTCPSCRSQVLDDDGGFRCSSPACALHAAGSFRFLGRWPVLVDFEHSILAPGNLPGAAELADAGDRRWSIDRLPPRLRRLWKPRNEVAAGNVERLLTLLPGPSPLLLVIGGGTVGNGVEAIYRDPSVRVIAFDIYPSPLTQFIADAHRIPLATGSIDAVLIQAVLEHVHDPREVVDEIHRVLRADGLVYAETPFLQPVHAGPYDFTRFTASGHRFLFRAFEQLAAGPVAGPGSQLLTSVDHMVRGLLRSELAGKLARGIFFWLRYLDRLVGPAYAMDDASAYYFLGRRSESELAPHEIVGYYTGAQIRGPRP